MSTYGVGRMFLAVSLLDGTKVNEIQGIYQKVINRDGRNKIQRGSGE